MKFQPTEYPLPIGTVVDASAGTGKTYAVAAHVAPQRGEVSPGANASTAYDATPGLTVNVAVAPQASSLAAPSAGVIT